jgi:NADH-quinone oxidoreductase subunit N
MTTSALLLLSPELAVAGVALFVLLFGSVVRERSLVAGVAIAGLVVPAALAWGLWGTDEEAFGGFLVVDNFAVFFKLLFLGAATLVILASQRTFEAFGRSYGEYCALVLLASLGLMLMASTGELITIYLALELNAISLIALVAFFKEGRSTEAGVKFLVLNGISSALLLYGMALIFGVTGTTVLREMPAALPEGGLAENPAVLAGAVLMMAGFGFKISSFPFQMWAPDVYEGAPTPVTAYLSVASKAAGFAVVLRVFYLALGPLALDWGAVFAVLAVASMTLGNLVAMGQNDIKRMLAYSTIAHAGYMLVGLAAVSARVPGQELLGPQGVLFYLAGYAFTNLGAFFAIIVIAQRTGSYAIDDFAGMARRVPLTAALLSLCLVSLIGVPPAVGFWAKIYLFNAAVSADLLWLAVAGVLNSVVSAYYYLRVIRVMYLEAPKAEQDTGGSTALGLALLVTAGGVLFFGIMPAALLDLAVRATQGFSS